MYAIESSPIPITRSHERHPPCAANGNGSAVQSEMAASSSTPRDRAIRVYSELAKDNGFLIARAEQRHRAHGHADVEHEHGQRTAIGRPGGRRNGLRHRGELCELRSSRKLQRPELTVPYEGECTTVRTHLRYSCRGVHLVVVDTCQRAK